MAFDAYRDKQESTGKIVAIFAFVFIFFVIFLVGSLSQILDDDNKLKLHKLKNIQAFRGSIKTSDGLNLAYSTDSWYLAVNGSYYKQTSFDLLSKLLSLYVDLNKDEILKILNQKKRTVLQEDIPVTKALELKRLSKKLDSMGIFLNIESNGIQKRYGLEVEQNALQKRHYPYQDLLTPMLGFVRKLDSVAITGLERYYDDAIREKEKGWIYAKKDAVGNIVYNNSLEYQPSIDGASIVLSVNSRLQKGLENLLDIGKKTFEAKEVIASIMESKTGNILAIASSNRYDPELIKEISNTKLSHVQYNFEPGSVIKPIIVSTAIDLGKIKRYDIFPVHKGRWRLENKTITDTRQDLDWLSVENIVVQSSNIGMSQIALKLKGSELKNALDRFEISSASSIDLPFERQSITPSAQMYDNSDIYKATTAYGYGFLTNFIKILKAYNAINNEGKLVQPRLAKTMITSKNEILKSDTKEKQIISPKTAHEVLEILRKTALEGTAKKASVDGIFVAGKTGTAHIAQEGVYVRRYNSSFFGFANDAKNKYTIGVTFIEPKDKYFSSQIATPLAKNIIELMIFFGFLTKT